MTNRWKDTRLTNPWMTTYNLMTKRNCWPSLNACIMYLKFPPCVKRQVYFLKKNALNSIWFIAIIFNEIQNSVKNEQVPYENIRCRVVCVKSWSGNNLVGLQGLFNCLPSLNVLVMHQCSFIILKIICCIMTEKNCLFSLILFILSSDMLHILLLLCHQVMKTGGF